MTPSYVFDRLVHARRLASAGARHEAVDILDRLLAAHAAADLRALIAGERAEIGFRGSDGPAETAAEALMLADPWRAEMEGCWTDYQRGHLETGLARAEPVVAGWHRRTERERARASLAIGKLHCDSGQLASARLWLVWALAESRSAFDIELIAAAFGALAEVHYLGGDLTGALDLLNADAALIPRGSTERDRLMVYRAHAYRQFGLVTEANALFEEARQSARLRKWGEAYAVRGLVWCAGLSLAGGADRTAGTNAIKEALDRLEELGDRLPLAHGLLGSAWVDAGLGESERATHQRLRAHDLFRQDGSATEAAWCGPANTETPTTVAPVPMVPAETPWACDQWILDRPLGDLTERRRNGRDCFDRWSVEAGIAWMGCFF